MSNAAASSPLPHLPPHAPQTPADLPPPCGVCSGLNKQQWARHAAALGFRFFVVPHHFLITLPHARPASWRPVRGTASDQEHTAVVAALYAAFERELS